MEDNEALDLDPTEYVIKENGHLWRGSWKRISKIPWNFGQVIIINGNGLQKTPPAYLPTPTKYILRSRGNSGRREAGVHDVLSEAPEPLLEESVISSPRS